MSLLVVKAAYDTEAGVWYVEDSDVPGLATEAPTLEALSAKLQVMIPELMALNGRNDDDDGLPPDVPIEIIAHMSSRVRLARVA